MMHLLEYSGNEKEKNHCWASWPFTTRNPTVADAWSLSLFLFFGGCRMDVDGIAYHVKA